MLGLNDSEEMALIDIMVCACKQEATRQGPPGRTVRKGKEKKSSVDDKKNLSAHFMQTLPSLLNKVCWMCIGIDITVSGVSYTMVWCSSD